MKRAYRTAVVFSLVCFISGCATLEAPKTPAKQWPVPPSEIVLQKADPVWASIKAQKDSFGHRLPMAEMIDLALQNNPSTRQAWENAKKAEAKKTAAESAWYPSVNALGLAKRGSVESNLKVNDLNATTYTAGGTLSFLAFDFGGRASSIQLAFENLLSANHQFNQSFQDLLRDTQKAYYELYSAQSDYAAKMADFETARTALNASKQKLRAGLVSKLDVYQAESNYYEARYNLESALVLIQIAKGNLAGILGFPADTAYDIEPPPQEVPVGILRQDVSRLISGALEQRPDVAAQRATVRSLDAAVGVAESALWPSVSLKSSGMKDWYQFYNADKRSGNDTDYYGQVEADWDVFNGYANLSKKWAAQADVRAAKEQLRRLELSVTQDVWGKFHQFKSAVRQNRFSHASLAASDASYKLALEGYKVGLKSILDLLQAQSDLSTARSNLIQSQKSLYVARIELIHAVGMTGRARDEWTTEMRKI